MRKLNFFTPLFFLLLTTTTLHAGQWKTYRFNIGKTDVEIHADSANLFFAQRVKEILTSDAPQLFTYFNYAPEKIHFTIDEEQIRANGYATPFPRNLIGLFDTPPLGLGHLAYTDDWLKVLVLHELVHIIHLDQTGGILQVIRTIFGSVGKLGGVVPRWFTEGVAVWAESKFTEGGRLKNKLLKYELLAAMNDPSFCDTVDCLDAPGRYPYGSNSYWLGGFFIDYIEKRKPGAVACMIKANSDNFPFFLNSAFLECTGKYANDLLRDFKKSFLAENQKKREIFQAHPFFKQLKPLPASYGYTAWQKGMALIGEHFYKMEISGDLDRREKLVQTNIVSAESKSFYLDEPIETLYNSDEQLLFSHFNQVISYDRSFSKFQEKKLKAIKEDLTDRYLFQDKSGKAYFINYEQNHWVIKDQDRELYRFPRFHYLSYPRFIKGKIYFKSFNENLKNKYLYQSFDPKNQELKTHYRSPTPFDYLESCSNAHILRGNQRSLLIVNERRNNQSVIKKINVPWAKEIAALRWNNDFTVVLIENDPRQVYALERGCEDILKDLRKEANETYTQENTTEMASKERAPDPKQLESYPSFRHFIPKWWFFGYSAGAGDQIKWSAYTSINDPENFHQAALTLDYYPSLNEVGGSVAYNYELFQEKFNTLYLSLLYERYFTKSSFSIVDNYFQTKGVGLQSLLSFSNWVYSPRINTFFLDEEDFTGQRKRKEYSLTQTFTHLPLFEDSFVKNFTFLTSQSYFDSTTLAGYWGHRFHSQADLRLIKRFYTHLHSSYGRLDKDTLSGGLLYGGGTDGLFSFYGLPSSDIYGNEIFQARGQLRFHVLDTHTGFGSLFPTFFKRFYLLGGSDYIKADRIYINDTLLRNKDLKSYHAGISTDMTFAYIASFTLDLIYADVHNDYGSNEGSVLVVIKASFGP